MLDEPAGSQLLDLLPVDGRLEAEIEGFQRLEVGEAGHGCVHGHLSLGLAGHLFGQAAVEERRIGQVLLAGLLEQLAVGALPLLILLILVNVLIDFIIPGSVPGWAIFAPIFVPLFIRLSVDPATVL